MARLLGLEELFEGRHFDREIIVLCVPWYLRFTYGKSARAARQITVLDASNPWPQPPPASRSL
jgi:hypothetical protein